MVRVHREEVMATLPTPQRRRKIKREIEALFKDNPKKTWWFSTLCEKTGGDLEDVVEVCRKLMKEGKIHTMHPSHQGRKMKAS